MIVMEEIAAHFDYNFSLIKDQVYELQPKEFTAYMREESSTRPFEKRTYIGPLGLPVKNRDTQPLPISNPPQGFPSVFVPIQYRLGYIIDKQTIEDELWKLLADRPKSMIRGAVVIKDMVASDILNNGTTAQTYDIDGQPLFSEDHPFENGSGTWSNLIGTSTPITTESVFNAVMVLLQLLTDSQNMPISYNGRVNIYVPKINPALCEQAWSVVNSQMNPDTTDNRANAAKMFNLAAVPLRYLTNEDFWFVGWEPSSPGYGLTLIDRVAPEISPLERFGDNRDVFYSRLRMRFTAGYETPRGIGAIGPV
jgi:Mu-like prophage major head subunit gpT